MSDTGAGDWNRLLKRFNDKVDRLGSAQIAQTSEISQLVSMQNRLIRDIIRISNRLDSLERIAAYRTKHSDENDPLKISISEKKDDDQK